MWVPAAVHDAVARAYDAQFRDELTSRPLDRALLESLVDLAGSGTIADSIADVGCGPGHVTRFLAARHGNVVGIDLSDLSERMIAIAQERAPGLGFAVGSMLQLPVRDDAWAGTVVLYSIIHLTEGNEPSLLRSSPGRHVRAAGCSWCSTFDSAEFAAGDVNHLTSWFGESVELDAYFMEPADVVGGIEAGFTSMATLVRRPLARR